MKKLIAILVSGLFVTVAAAQTASPGTGMKAVAETKKLRAGTELDAKHAEDMKKAKQARAKKAKKGAQKSVKKVSRREPISNKSKPRVPVKP